MNQRTECIELGIDTVQFLGLNGNGNCEILFKNRDKCGHTERERAKWQGRNEKDGNVGIWYIRCSKPTFYVEQQRSGCLIANKICIRKL